MDYPHTQPLLLQLNVFVTLHPAVFLEVVVELLDLDGGQFVQPDISQLGDDVVVDVIQVIIFGFSLSRGSA